MEALLHVLAVFFVLGLVVLVIYWHYSRSNTLLEEWARRHGLRIISSEYRYFFRGPFFWTPSKGQTVYRVTVADDQGHERRGWVRCGGWFLGLLSDKVEVRWDE